jgi:formylglycine-generating enzyme required for sulfatase activity
MLRKGHSRVQLDPESWDRLLTWIDLNAPFHGTWTEAGWDPGKQRERRRDLAKLYAGIDDDPEADASLEPATLEAPKAAPLPPIPDAHRQIANPQGWPFGPDEAKKRQAAAGPLTKRTIDLGEGLSMELVLVPAGSFVMGDGDGGRDELPLSVVKIDRPFWMGACEVSNEQFARFDPAHDSRVESKLSYQFGVHGYPCNQPAQPVVRITWQHARDFCQWLSDRTGERFDLPTEAQWEWACRAGSAEAFAWGGMAADYSKLANLGDATLRQLASNPYTVDQPLKNPTKYDDWVPKDTRFNDGSLLTVAIGSYQPNAWGLRDMHGNAAEWTRTAYRPYPYKPDDGRDDPASEGLKVVRGGSWRDRPQRCRAAFRLAYRPWQKVYNVTFRVVGEAKGKKVAAVR